MNSHIYIAQIKKIGKYYVLETKAIGLVGYKINLRRKKNQQVPGAGLEPAWSKRPRDFKSLASTSFATPANVRRRPDSNR